MAQWPLITVVTPCYNKVEYVRATIESVLSQNYPNLEYIVQDPGSTDGTLEILREYASRITLVIEKDKGQSDALNKGFRRGRGEVLGWLNADDIYYPGALGTVGRYFSKHPASMVLYGEIDFLDEDGAVRKHVPGVPFDYDLLLNYYNYIPQPSTFIRRRVFEEVGDVDITLHEVMDYDYWLRAGRRYSFDFVPETLSGIRIMETTKTGIQPTRVIPAAMAAARRHGQRYLSPMRLWYWLWRLGGAGMVRFIADRMRRRRLARRSA